MAGTNTTPPASFWTRLEADLKRDPKKTGLMLVLAVVAAVMGVRWYGGQHAMPAPAAAAVAIEPSPALAAKVGAARAERPQVRKGGDQEQRAKYLARMDRNINRDLFRAGPEYFPAAGDAEEAANTAAAHGGWLSDMVEQLTQQQTAQRERLDQLAAIHVQAQGLNLQGTILGATPTALVNGQPMQVGQSIGGFTITEITPNACRLTREGITVELRMKK